MRDRYVVDTGVLIVASAANPGSPSDIDATPEDPALQRKVWEWLSAFLKSDSRMVIDYGYKIPGEYKNKLTDQDFGIQVFLGKWNTGQVDQVTIEYDSEGDGILPKALARVVHDRADRKMVAAALGSHADYGEGCVAFASDTDWHDWEEELKKHDVLLEPIIEEWSRKKHAEKKKR